MFPDGSHVRNLQLTNTAHGVDARSTDNTVKISNIRLTSDGSERTLSADCGGFEVYYRFPDAVDVRLSADPFVAACLVPAMYLGTDIEVESDAPLSTVLLENLQTIQSIYSLWEDQLRCKLQPVKITGAVPTRPDAASGVGVASFFSGGVDGTYTFLSNREEIDFLLFVKGIDMQLSSTALFAEALEKNREYLRKRGKVLHTCETNVRFLGYEHGLSWTVCFGGGLSSIALAAGLQKLFLASGQTYAETTHEGSNYITDHLWGNGVTQIVHDGAEVRRARKLALLAEDTDALEILRVCWHDRGYNCGECEKCLRTMTSLRLLRIESPGFPPLTDKMIKEKIASMRIYSEPNFAFVEENLRLAQDVGDVVLEKALKRVRRSYLLRRHARGILNALTT